MPKNISNQFNTVCNEYVNLFCEKQGLAFEGWTDDIIGGIAKCGDLYFNFLDIVWDINSNQKKGLIIDWYNESFFVVRDVQTYFNYTKNYICQNK